jgi:CCR4-NOT transcription complex subunit 3
MSPQLALAQQMVDMSSRYMPESAETERQRSQYVPRTPHKTPSYYPQTPLPQFERASFFAELDPETLFFVFYFHPQSMQQYLAARELKRNAWRFHKKWSAWFQRDENPTNITDEYEQGTYIYFDFEPTVWRQRKKADFTFEYRYLEDQEFA